MERELDPDTERALAVDLYNEVWALLDAPERTPEACDLIVHCAHASAWHWSRVGTEENQAIGEWQIARVYSELGRPEPALHHAERTLELAAVASIPWLTASACEGMARALAVAGDPVLAAEWRDKAIVALGDIEDPEDREVIERDLASLPLG